MANACHFLLKSNNKQYSPVWDIPHLELLQLAGHQGLSLSQRCVAALNALVHLLHGGLAVLTTAGAAPEHEALGKDGRERLGKKTLGTEMTTECNRG